MSRYNDTRMQVEHLVRWVEAEAYPKYFDTSFIKAMDREGGSWTGNMETAIDNIYTKFRVAQWIKKNAKKDC